jgi:hypothetical protein
VSERGGANGCRRHTLHFCVVWEAWPKMGRLNRYSVEEGLHVILHPILRYEATVGDSLPVSALLSLLALRCKKISVSVFSTLRLESERKIIRSRIGRDKDTISWSFLIPHVIRVPLQIRATKCKTVSLFLNYYH